MSEIKSGGLGQCGAEPFKQQQFGTAGIEGVNRRTVFIRQQYCYHHRHHRQVNCAQFTSFADFDYSTSDDQNLTSSHSPSSDF